MIGAGAAGLSAAVTLKEAGRDFVVLEARDRLGGRAYSAPLSDGTAMEHGAALVTGPSVATWDYILRFGLRTHREGGSRLGPLGGGTPTWRRGEWVTDDDSMAQEVNDLMNEVFGVPNPDDISLRDALMAAGLSGARLETAESRFGWLLPADEVSARMASEFWDVLDVNTDPISGLTRHGNPNFKLVDGYSRLWEELSRTIADEIHLNAPVTSIEWSESGVIARGADGEFRGLSAIVTIPVGVLGAGTVEFSPPLPSRKQAVFDQMRGGNSTGVIAEFRRAWWEDWLGPVGNFRRVDPAPFRAFGNAFWNMPGPPTLRTGVSWPYLLDATGRPDRIRSLFFESLGEMFKGLDIEAELVGFEITDWTSDPWTMGGPGAVVPVGGFQLRADLAAPTPPLYWAGEASHTRGLPGVVNGALETGRRAAFEVLHTLRPLYVNDPDSRLDWREYNTAADTAS